MERHDGRSPGFKMKVTGMFGGDATKRQVRDSVKDPANTGPDIQAGRVATSEIATGPALIVLSRQQSHSPGTDVIIGYWRQEGLAGLPSLVEGRLD